ncbi:glycosyltransferase family 2 protein [Undibacterium flavidum]|uniref:Glycosyltransferase family 2 protein n=1 Tax=Undibacterium flavidum TaxID=2762297 RepID=A0ABR6Y7Q3_9BURK|nr:glycosyltransferase family 2 protein [Undibacterium flavidum]MBC3872197.1 glycosyltransferase family 2 protein [Undibacterium flavidum]
MHISAIVVGYFPDKQILESLLCNLSQQVDSVFLVDNGGCSDIELNKLANCEHLRLGENFGLGYALNRGFEAALKRGAKYVATFDQDSQPPDDLIKILVEQAEELSQRGVRVGAIGPRFFDRREISKIYFPFFKEEQGRISTIQPAESQAPLIQSDVLITSGMLVPIDVWLDDLSYDESLFIDLTDNDWCFRVRQKNYLLFGSTKVEMGHAMSEAPPRRIFSLHYFKTSPTRKYYNFRNTLIFCRKPYVSKIWANRLKKGLFIRFFLALLLEKNRWKQMLMMVRGILDGIKN